MRKALITLVVVSAAFVGQFAHKTDAAGSGLDPDSVGYVLAASWEPAFCATDAGRGKEECETMTAESVAASNFSLHGLWPDNLSDREIFPCYCDRGGPVTCDESRRRDRKIDISPSVLHELTVVMPGALSGLHLHEWPKHGSCYEDDKSGADRDADPDEYFSEAMALVDALNRSAVRDLFADHLGEVLSRREIEAAFDESFGAGASARLVIDCDRVDGERVIAELRIGLEGAIGEVVDLVGLVQAAPPASVWSKDRSCPGGRVVRAF